MTLEEFRKEINEIDSQVLNLIRRRMEIAESIGKFKRKNNLPILDTSREKEIFEKLDRLAEEMNLDKLFIKDLFALIIKKSKEKQR